MLLGSLMHQLQDEAASFDALLSLGDILLIAEVEAARAPHDEQVGEYVAGAVKRFAIMAHDEDWLRLMTALENSDQPVAACLKAMLHWSIAHDTKVSMHPAAGCLRAGGDGGCHDEN